MAVSDTIADMLTRLRNAAAARKPQVRIPNSKIASGIAKVLKEEGYITGFDVVADGRQGLLRIDLKYGPNGEQLIHTLHRESKPGCRVYRKVDDLPRPLAGLGIAIVSTSKGVLSDRQAREQKVGGELLCTVE